MQDFVVVFVSTQSAASESLLKESNVQGSYTVSTPVSDMHFSYGSHMQDLIVVIDVVHNLQDATMALSTDDGSIQIHSRVRH